MTDQESAAKGTDFQGRGSAVAKSELGTKRIDPETGRKFYDLNKDPIVSPYTGKTYPRSYFDSASSKALEEEEEVEEKELDTEEEGAEVVSLEEADDEAKTADDLPEIEDEEDVDLGDDDEDVFLEDEEEDDDDVSDIIGVGDDDDV
nr:TIGR02300 family protein [Mesorhizobium camelthorni]